MTSGPVLRAWRRRYAVAAAVVAALTLAGACSTDADPPARQATSRIRLPAPFAAASARPGAAVRRVSCGLRPGRGEPTRTVTLAVPAAYHHRVGTARSCSWSDDADDAFSVTFGAGVLADASAELDDRRNGVDAGNSSGTRDLRYRSGVRAFRAATGESLEYLSDGEGVPVLVQERGEQGLVLACVARDRRAGTAHRPRERRLCDRVAAGLALH